MGMSGDILVVITGKTGCYKHLRDSGTEARMLRTPSSAHDSPQENYLTQNVNGAKD